MKCLPVSRRNVEQVDRRQPVGVVHDARGVATARRSRGSARAARGCPRRSPRPARRVSSCRSCDLPLGSPIMPVPPPTSAIGVWPKRCRRASAITVSSDPNVQARRRGIEADVRGDALAGEQVGEAFRRVVDQAAPGEFVEQTGHRQSVLLYQSMATVRPAQDETSRRDDEPPHAAQDDRRRQRRRGDRRRRVRHVYERDAIGLTEVDVPVAGLPPRPGRSAHRSPDRCPSQPLGLGRRCRGAR